MSIYESVYKGLKSIVMESDEVIAVFVPELGSKMASLVSKKTGREFFYQTRWEEFKKPLYADNFESYDLSGFDEMFPTVDECTYPDYPWKGTVLPDHGEVWALPWEYAIGDGWVDFWVYGVRMPYKLSKRIFFAKQDVVRIEYKLDNLSCLDMKYIWCAHMLKACSINTQIILPKCVDKIITTKPFSDRLGDFGTIHTWPVTTDMDGRLYEMNTIKSRETGKCEKFFAYDALTEGWCAIQHKDTNEVLGLSFPVAKIPYLGIWISEGGLDGHYHLALEPASGCFDGVDIATQWNRISQIKAKTTEQWHLNISVAQKDTINSISEQGDII